MVNFMCQFDRAIGYLDISSNILTVSVLWIRLTFELVEWTKQIIFPNMVSWVQFSCSVVSDSLWPHELQHSRPPSPSTTPGIYPNSCSSSRWCHPAISSSVVPFSSCPQSLPASESCPMSQLFAWGGQSTGASALASFLPKKSQGWFSTYILGECIIRPHLPLHGRVSL